MLMKWKEEMFFAFYVCGMLLMLLMLLLRSTSDYRSRKKLRAAREEAQRLEEEIDAKSTAEIEEELRQAMKQEEEDRNREDWKKDPGLKDLNLSDDSDSPQEPKL